MVLVGVGSVRSSPGATTLAVLIGAAWPRPVMLLEVDPDGGVLAARYGLGRDPGLAGLAAAMHGARPAEGVVWEHAQQLPGGLPVVVAHESAEVAAATLTAVGGRLARWCRSLRDVDVVADVGRLRAGSPASPLVEAADVVLVAVRPRREELYAAVHRTRGLGDGRSIAGLVLVGERPYGADEVRTQLDVPVVGAVADDARAARLLREGGSSRALRVSPLVRSVRSLTDEITADLGIAPPDVDALEAPHEVSGWSDGRERVRLRADPATGASGDGRGTTR